MKLKIVSALLAFTSLTAPAFAQDVPPPAEDVADESAPIIVTGSRIKRDPTTSVSPLQIISAGDLTREGIANPEQLVSFLTANGNGLDNLASNADVVDGAARGNNGASSANLRGQGANATLVLLNGRRVAAHGLNGGVVDINQIPFSAVERVEVLKDGASAIYGTDAIGGVINFILKKDYQGVTVQSLADVTEAGGGNNYRVSGLAGYGDLDKDGFNVMGAVGYSWAKELRGDQRDFVNTFQPDRGLVPETRGSPFGTIVPLAGTIIPSGAVAPFFPGSTTVRASGGINPLDLPGGAGCSSVDGQGAYDDLLWDFAEARFACAWDTGRAAVLQQPLQTLTYLARGVVRLGDHEIVAEVTGSDADSAKKFSNLQLVPNNGTQRFTYNRVVGVNDAVYDRVFNQVAAVFPTLEASRGLPLAYRWRCIECGRREIRTNTKTQRFFIGADGPLGAGWDYSVGLSRATSEAKSELGGGYYFRGTTATGANDPNAPVAPGLTQRGIIGVLNSGLLNPFLLPGQTQSAEGLAALEAVSARGTTLFDGKFTTTQFDASVSGSLFSLPGGTVKAAVGVDYRKEIYTFNGDPRAEALRPVVIAAPFDNGNILPRASREVKAAYAEVLLPVLESLEVVAAARIDEYSGFGSTVNPRIGFRFEPIRQISFRGSYNTGFRVPSFNQIFNGRTEALFTGRDIADPRNCPGGRVDNAVPGCASVQPLIIQGGNPNLGPEDSQQFGLGVVLTPINGVSLTVDWWRIKRTGTLQILTLQQLADNFATFEDRYVRDAAGTLISIDQSLINAGETVTSGIDFAANVRADLGGGSIFGSLDGTLLLQKKSKVTPTSAFGASEVGLFTFAGDLGLKWKHNLNVGYSTDKWIFSATQIFRLGYTNRELPGVTSGLVTPPNLVRRVKDYVTYNLSVRYQALKFLSLTAGVKNVFDTDPPFAINYDDNLGSGSSWEPRVADPRGRAFSLLAEVKF